MAPSEAVVARQTAQIIYCLLEDECAPASRAFKDEYETDGNGDDFDPVLIADKLRSIADSMNEDAMFQAALSGLRKAAAEEAVEAAFSSGVDAVCKAHTSKGPEVAPEMQLIRASVAFGLYVKKSSPELKSKVQTAMAAFLNRRVGSWVERQGGWSKVPDVAE
ncbi:uncharacterized protein ACNS7B_005693 [Menidia menidia]